MGGSVVLFVEFIPAVTIGSAVVLFVEFIPAVTIGSVYLIKNNIRSLNKRISLKRFVHTKLSYFFYNEKYHECFPKAPFESSFHMDNRYCWNRWLYFQISELYKIRQTAPLINASWLKILVPYQAGL